MSFIIEFPKVKDGKEIEKTSLSIIEEEAENYQEFSKYNAGEKEVVKRLIHTTSCFEEVLQNIIFTNGAVNHIGQLLKQSASIIVDTNMIKSGLSQFYLNKYNNQVLCFVNEEEVKNEAEKAGTTRTYIAVKKALEKTKEEPVILACGNAPTFLYSAIETLVNENYDLSNIAIIAFPVGFVNVVESKDYTLGFLKHFNAEGIVMQGRFGSSTMIVSCLHAIYRLI